MVSLEQYLDSQAAKVAEYIVKIYKTKTADSLISETLEQKIQDAEKIVEVYQKQGVKAAFDEVLKIRKDKGKPVWYYLFHNSKDITFYIMKELDIRCKQVFKEYIIKCCEEYERPAILDDLDDSLLDSYFKSYLMGYLEKLRFYIAGKKAKKNIKKLVKKHYAGILSLLHKDAGEVEALVWEGRLVLHCCAVEDEIMKLSNKYMGLDNLSRLA